MSERDQVAFDLPRLRRLVTCSPTKLATWVDCPRRFRYSYLDAPRPKKGPPWAHLSYGTSAHNALRGWWDLSAAKRVPGAAGQLVRTGWLSDGFRDAGQSARWREAAAASVTEYAAHLDAEVQPRGVERTVGMRTDVLAFSGRVDRLDERDGELVVVDYKFGRHRSSDIDARSSMALALYAEACQRMFHQTCRRVELHHVPSGTVAAWDHTDTSIERQVGRAESIAREIGDVLARRENQAADASQSADELFPTKPSSMCGWCDFRGVCPAGQAAGPAHQPWDGLGDLDGTSDAVTVT